MVLSHETGRNICTVRPTLLKHESDLTSVSAESDSDSDSDSGFASRFKI